MTTTAKYKRISIPLHDEGLIVTRHCNVSKKRGKNIINRLYEKSKKDGPLVRSKDELVFMGSNKSIMKNGKDLFIFETPHFSKHMSSLEEMFKAGFEFLYNEELDLWEPLELLI